MIDSGLEPSPFIIFGLPRSRTAWLAELLSYDGWTCHHEPSPYFQDFSDLVSLLDVPKTGISDSGLTLLWRQIAVARPDVKIVAIRRRTQDVIDSCAQIGLLGCETSVKRIEETLTEVEDYPGALCIPYADLDYVGVCDAIFQFCLGVPLPATRWERYRNWNIQASLQETRRKIESNPEGIRRVFGAAMAA